MKKTKKEKPKKILCPETDQLDHLTEPQADALLEDLCRKLDELSMDDFFGTEGWRHFMGYRD